MFFESHAHYDDEAFDSDRFELIEKMHNNGIEYIVNIGADIKSSLSSIELSKKYSFIYAAIGVHPHETENMKDEDIDILQEYINNEKIVAVGEIGLDYYYEHSNREKQKYWFKKQLHIARNNNKPVIIHSRDAAKQCYEIIKDSGVRKGVIHSYSGSVEMAKDYIEMGFFIGIGGILTFKNARKSVEVAESIPIEKILIETDSPYLSPVPVRGVRNNSQNLVYIVEKLAQVKQITAEKVAEITKKNALTLFDIK